MAIGFYFNGNPLTGSSIDDFITDLGFLNGGSNTINGLGGDDLIIGDIGYHYQLSSSSTNNSIAAATNMTTGSIWTTDENPMVANYFIPHATAFVEATAGQTEFFAVDVGAGQTLTADIDFGNGSAIGTNVDTYVVIRDSGGNIVAFDDDSALTEGGAGSTSTFDSCATYTPGSAGTYYVEVRKYLSGGGTTFTGGETFVLNLSVTGHATYGTATPVGADVITGGTGNDTIYGVAGDDTIIWNAGDGSDTINGGSGSDLLDVSGSTSGWTIDLRAGTGSNGSDSLILASMEKLTGTNYADVLTSSGFGSIINAGGGNDYVYAVLGAPETLDGGSGVDTIDTTDYSSAGTDYAINMVTGVTSDGESYTNFENLVSGGTDDTITGTIAANVITTNGGYDIVHAGEGADKVYGGDGGGYLYGDEADDKLYGGTGTDYLYGGTGRDYMYGGDGTDVYYVDQANDRVIETSTGGFDYVYSNVTYTLSANIEELILYGSGPINGRGNASDNYIYGTDDKNTLGGLDGADYLVGYGGNDALDGGRGADSMYGGDGNDTYYVKDVGDSVIENASQGTADKVVASIDYTLTDNVEILLMTGTSRNGTGNGLANTITGSDGNDTISGLAGGDTLRGGTGNDTIYGGDDNDNLFGEAGRDTLQGDGGADRFNFREGDTGSTNATADKITDFAHGVDKIILTTIDANANTGANDAFSWLGTGAFTHAAGELRYQTSGGDTYVQGDTNGDGTADLIIRLTGTIPLTVTDFGL